MALSGAAGRHTRTHPREKRPKQPARRAPCSTAWPAAWRASAATPGGARTARRRCGPPPYSVARSRTRTARRPARPAPPAMRARLGGAAPLPERTCVRTDPSVACRARTSAERARGARRPAAHLSRPTTPPTASPPPPRGSTARARRGPPARMPLAPAPQRAAARAAAAAAASSASTSATMPRSGSRPAAMAPSACRSPASAAARARACAAPRCMSGAACPTGWAPELPQHA